MTSVAIVGGGLAGCGVALELASRGQRSMLIERDETLMNRASLRNEGKIHLGLIYANDATRRTGSGQLRGALRFQGLVTSWLGSDAWLSRSTPFHYVVADDSLLGVDALSAHFDDLRSDADAQLRTDAALDYLGLRPTWFTRPLEAAHRKALYGPRIVEAFETEELAVDTDRLARHVREAVTRNPLIDVHTTTSLETVERVWNGFRLRGRCGRSPESFELVAEQVVNATWEQRLRFDAQLGMAAPPTLLHRLKFRVIAELPADRRGFPSATMVLGAYGDVVVRTNGIAYLSWYPEGLQGWTSDPVPPSAWDGPCHGEVDPVTAADLGAKILAGVDAWYPGFGGSRPLTVDAGAIVALGTTDVDDPSSGLHLRSAIGVTSCDGYHSLDPGKLTTAPMFAVDAADAVQCRIQDVAGVHAGDIGGDLTASVGS